MQLWLFLFNAFQAASQVSTALVSHFAREMDTSVVWTAHDFRLSMIAISIMLPYAAFRARTATGTVQKSPCAADLSLDPTNSKCVSSQMSRFFFSSLSLSHRQFFVRPGKAIPMTEKESDRPNRPKIPTDFRRRFDAWCDVALRCITLHVIFHVLSRGTTLGRLLLKTFEYRCHTRLTTRPWDIETSTHRDIETSNSEETGMKRIEKRGWKKMEKEGMWKMKR